jgi:hypothetical protein
VKWLFSLLAGALVLGGGVVGVVAVVNEPGTEKRSVPEPVEPVILIEATGLIGGGSELVHLRDATGHDFDFRVTRSDVEVRDERHNRLIVVDGSARWVVALDSVDEDRLKRALVMAINSRRRQSEASESNAENLPLTYEENRSLMHAEAALERFSHLGKPWPY